MKKLIYKNIFAQVEVIKAFMKTKEDAEHLAEELQKYPCLYEKLNRGHKETDQKENAWRAV